MINHSVIIDLFFKSGNNADVIFRIIQDVIVREKKEYFKSFERLPAETALQRCSYKKVVLKICSKFTAEHPCQNAISIKLLLKSHFGMGVFL